MPNKIVIGLVVLMLLLSATACKHGQSDDTAKQDDFDNGIITTAPFDSDILDGEDRKSDDDETNSLNVVTCCFHDIPFLDKIPAEFHMYQMGRSL